MLEKLKKFLKWISIVEDLDEEDEEVEYEEYDANIYDFNMKLEIPAEEAEFLVKEVKEFILGKLRDEFEDRYCFFYDTKISPIDVSEDYPSGLENLVEEIPQIPLHDDRTA